MGGFYRCFYSGLPGLEGVGVFDCCGEELLLLLVRSTICRFRNNASLGEDLCDYILDLDLLIVFGIALFMEFLWKPLLLHFVLVALRHP